MPFLNNFLACLGTCLILLKFMKASMDQKQLTAGYIIFCPCMGRFGNQVDQVLGALAFAKRLNRTLVLPPWIDYHAYPSYDSTHVPFEDYFELEPVLKFHSVITMEAFMNGLAGDVWPPEKRVAYCPGPSPGKREGHCNPKGSFWEILNVEFVDSKFFPPLTWDSSGAEWNAQFPPATNPVLGFPGAPASFPLKSAYRHIQSVLLFKPEIVEKAKRIIDGLLNQRYIGVHLRNKADWTEACSGINVGRNHFFASPQCLGDNFEKGLMKNELCLPPKKMIIRKIRMAVKRLDITTVFVASDNDHMIEEINQAMERRQVKAHKLPDDLLGHPLEIPVTLQVLARADYFIGNCASSFTSYVVRQRDTQGKQSGFWGIKGIGRKDEL